MPSDCLFCDRSNIHLICGENDLSYAQWDQYPVSQGHALIIPKRHIASFFELTTEEVLAIFSLLQETKDVIDTMHAPDAYNIGINNSTAAGQTIHHVHVHIMPRYEGDVEHPQGGVRHIIPGKGNY